MSSTRGWTVWSTGTTAAWARTAFSGSAAGRAIASRRESRFSGRFGSPSPWSGNHQAPSGVSPSCRTRPCASRDGDPEGLRDERTEEPALSPRSSPCAPSARRVAFPAYLWFLGRRHGVQYVRLDRVALALDLEWWEPFQHRAWRQGGGG